MGLLYTDLYQINVFNTIFMTSLAHCLFFTTTYILVLKARAEYQIFIIHSELIECECACYAFM